MNNKMAINTYLSTTELKIPSLLTRSQGHYKVPNSAYILKEEPAEFADYEVRETDWYEITVEW